MRIKEISEQSNYNNSNLHNNIIYSDKFEEREKFVDNLLENIEYLDPEFSKVIDENYWDLI